MSLSNHGSFVSAGALRVVRTTPPTLETERLILRVHTLADFAGCFILWSDPDVTHFVGGRPSTAEEIWSRMLRYAGHWQLLGYGYFVVTDRETGTIIGECGLANFHRDIEPSLGDTPEAGWVLLPQYQRRGLAREALTAVLAWADAAKMPRTVCMVDPENRASLRLATSVGYSEYARTTYKDTPSILLERVAH